MTKRLHHIAGMGNPAATPTSGKAAGNNCAQNTGRALQNEPVTARSQDVDSRAANHHLSHTHTHDPEEIKAIVNRLARATGHLDSVRKMVEDGKDCSDVLVQLAAVRSEINNAGKLLLKEHMAHCIVEAVAEGDHESLDKMNRAIDLFMR
ncbi:DNA-binding transcriptional regulator, FrmR family [Lachnospiraceae bacterium NK3A20]|nr:DNA-binding transcriptional regulator, FrmR family [Lachnospiraceae bacterium NK3A20]